MSIAITDEHRALAQTVSDFLVKNGARAAARALLKAENEELPSFWRELGELGWLGLAIPEEHGGSGFGLPELVIVAEEMGRAVAPGPFVPTVTAGAVIATAGSPDARARFLPGLADGSLVGAVALGGNVRVSGGTASGSAGVVLGGHVADVIVVSAGDDIAIIERGAGGVSVQIPANLDPARRAARVTLDAAPTELVPGARQVLVDVARTLLAAEATAVARQATEMASEYAKVREQFGRPIGMFQAVKHHCANMLVAAEQATAGVWDAARAAAGGGDQLSYTAAIAAALAVPAASLDAELNIQVHGGIGFTWEHDAHLYLRRATAIAAAVDLPPEAEQIRAGVRQVAERIRGLDADAQRRALIESGYVMPHWPKPWGREAGAVEQLVI